MFKSEKKLDVSLQDVFAKLGIVSYDTKKISVEKATEIYNIHGYYSLRQLAIVQDKKVKNRVGSIIKALGKYVTLPNEFFGIIHLYHVSSIKDILPDAYEIIVKKPNYLLFDSNNLKQLEELLKLGYDIETKNSLGVTPLLDACFCHLSKKIIFLLEHGADPYVKDTYGNTILHILCRNSNNINVINYLILKCKKSLDTANNNGEYPLDVAKDNFKMLLTLLENGIKNTKNQEYILEKFPMLVNYF